MDERVKSSNKRDAASAVIFGATGLVGGELWRTLEQDPAWSSVTCIGRRRPPGLGKHDRVKSVTTDLFDPSLYQQHLDANVVFICLGTTLKQAGSKAAFKRIDVDLPELIATHASRMGSQRLIVISAQGIHRNSLFFYNRAKADMEEKVRSAFQGDCCFIRPGLLLGERQESRVAESLFAAFLTRIDGWIQHSSMRKFRAIPARTVAQAMNRISQKERLPSIIENSALFDLGQSPGRGGS